MIGALKLKICPPSFHALKCINCQGYGILAHKKINSYYYYSCRFTNCKECCRTGVIPIPLSEIL